VRIAGLGDDTTVPAGTVLVSEGDRPWWTYLIVDGAVAVSSGDSPVGIVRAGHFCGDVPVVSRQPSARRLTTLTTTRVLVFGRREFLGALDELPGLASAVMRSLATQANEAQAALAGASPADRLSAVPAPPPARRPLLPRPAFAAPPVAAVV
jgi:CRP-like cAMP-binding protein